MEIALIVIPIAVLAISLLVGWRKNIYQALLTFGVTTLSVLLSALITELLSPHILEWSEPLLKGALTQEISNYIFGTQVGHELSQATGALASPLFFFEVFVVVLVVLSLIALIPLHFMSDKYKQKKAAKLAANGEQPAEQEAPAEQEVLAEQEVPAEQEAPTAQDKNKKLLLKIATMAISVVSGFIIFSYLMMPVTCYSDAVARVDENIKHIVGDNEGIISIIDDIGNINSHPTTVLARFINLPVTNGLNSVKIDTKDGPINDHAVDILNSTIRFADRVYKIDATALQSKDLIEIANIVDDDYYLQHFMNHVIHDACDSWKKGEPFMGIEPIIYVNESVSQELYDLLATADVVKVMKMSGRLLNIVEVTTDNNSTPGDNPVDNPNNEPKKGLAEVVEELFHEVDDDSVAIVEKLLTSEVMDEVSGEDTVIGEVDSTVFSSVISAVNEVKLDEGKTEEQKVEEIKKGAESLAKIVELSQDNAEADAEEILETFVSSDVLMQTAVKVAETTEKDDPLNIKDKMTDSALAKVEDKLLEYGYELGSPEHEAILRLLGK